MAGSRWSGPSRHRSVARRGGQREPLAIGWGARDQATRGDTVVGLFDRARLSDGLAQLHGNGFGPASRVLDGARGDLSGQAARAGLPADLVDRFVALDQQRSALLLVVHAPARGARVAELLVHSGAMAVEVILPERAAIAALPVDPDLANVEPTL